ncbi:entericidin A/B family lipoprotein [Paenirhodobacter sp.]|jgi:predicted small secreted protein
MRKILFPLLALAALSACETVKGAGQDISTAGNAVTHEASKAQSNM